MAPVSDGAEAKIAASCAAVKAVNPTADCYMYVESDVARSFYSLGHWVEAHKETAAFQSGQEKGDSTSLQCGCL